MLEAPLSRSMTTRLQQGQAARLGLEDRARVGDGSLLQRDHDRQAFAGVQRPGGGKAGKVGRKADD